MANLDTTSKRRSHLHMLKPYDGVLPLPDATLSQGDRQHLAWIYSGILAAASTTTTTTPSVFSRSLTGTTWNAELLTGTSWNAEVLVFTTYVAPLTGTSWNAEPSTGTSWNSESSTGKTYTGGS